MEREFALANSAPSNNQKNINSKSYFNYWRYGI